MSIWKRKSLRSFEQELGSETHQLRRALGPWDLIALGIGAIIGAGLFSITGMAAAQNAGPAIVLSFLLAATGCSFAGLCYSELASMIPVAGSAYTYTYATLGRFSAWMIGWTLILEYAIGAVTVSVSWSAYVFSLLEGLGLRLPAVISASPWQPVHYADGTTAYGIINLPAVLILAAISWLLIIGIKESVKVNAIIVFLKVAVVILFIGLGFFYINVDNYTPFIPPNTGTFGEFGFSGILRAAGIIFFAYIGFDTVSTAAQETRNPNKDIPIGIIGSLAICSVLYVLFSLVLTGLVPYQELNRAAPIAYAIDQTPFVWIGSLIKLAILAGFTSVMLVMLLGQSRIFYAMARDKLIPEWFADVHPAWQTPWHANIALFTFTALIAAFTPMSIVGHMTSIGTLLAFVVVCVAVIILRIKEPDAKRPFKVPLYPLVPILGILSCLTMMISLELGTWLRLLIWLAIGIGIYLLKGKDAAAE